MVFTTIYHPLRKSLGLSTNDYCVADMIYHLSSNPAAPVTGWCNSSREHMAEVLGLTRQSVINIIKTLEGKGLVERNDIGLLRTTQTWFDALMGCKESLQSDRCADVKKVYSQKSLRGVKTFDTPRQKTLQQGVKTFDPIYKEDIESEKEAAAADAPTQETPQPEEQPKAAAAYIVPPNLSFSADELADLEKRLTADLLQIALDKLAAFKKSNGDKLRKGTDYGHMLHWAIAAARIDPRPVPKDLPLGFDSRKQGGPQAQSIATFSMNIIEKIPD